MDQILKFPGYGYCQSIEDLRHNKDLSASVVTTELLLDNSNTISHDNQVSAFKVETDIHKNNEKTLTRIKRFCFPYFKTCFAKKNFKEI